MYKDKGIGVVMPAYNEEKLIEKALKNVPEFVDKIIVVDDGSKDKTLEIIKREQEENERIVIIHHRKNEGLGKSLIDGYEKSLQLNLDVVAVMAGDAQMDPDDLPSVLNPIVRNSADYVKGNRLLTSDVAKVMPRVRYIGNAILTLLTKIATGYWHVIDPQCGYTAVKNSVLKKIDFKKIWKGYGYNADILAKLNVLNYNVCDVPVKPVYGLSKSGIKYSSYIPSVSWLLIKLFFWRLKEKYIIRDFHPLIFFYFYGITSLIWGFIKGLRILYLRKILGLEVGSATIILCALLIITGMQGIFFAMLFDSEYNRNLEIYRESKSRELEENGDS